MNTEIRSTFGALSFVTAVAKGRCVENYHKNQQIYRQGEPSNAVFYIQHGRVKVGVTSAHGKEAVFAVLGHDDFFGEGCLVDQAERTSSATALGSARVMRIEKSAFMQALQDEPDFARLFLTRMVTRALRTEADLVDQLSNSTEKRLARLLLNLADNGKETYNESVVAKITQEALAAMIGSTRSRVSYFMNRFRKLGYIDYKHGIKVEPTLLTAFLNDEPGAGAWSGWAGSECQQRDNPLPS